MKEGEGAALREAVAGAYVHGFAQNRGAVLQMVFGLFGVERREPAQGDSQVVEGDAAGDLALSGAPLQGPLEVGHRFGEIFGGFSEVGERCREVVQGPSVPAALLVRMEMVEGD